MAGRTHTLKYCGQDRDFYDGKRWQTLRQTILRRDGYQCQECRRYGKNTSGAHVHHVMPREQFPQYQYDPRNLITLCDACHDRMHYRTDRTLTDKGKELARRIIRKYNIDIEV